jgi:hypothetical protein
MSINAESAAAAAVRQRPSSTPSSSYFTGPDQRGREQYDDVLGPSTRNIRDVIGRILRGMSQREVLSDWNSRYLPFRLSSTIEMRLLDDESAYVFPSMLD